ncbi:hypothetical protein HW450_12645 [Corynebacterium hindlerae]|uniref:Secreted protein n=1 Tax=Corynebacterium hindlerae TaxID=699041 RepID=A0A7G5FEW1_9CORY|nr:hypothetical protein [Corynebacterium hindlerae]QMV85152.1 hypothetical protein HW450_12645 [Corynebacterium hindlerae]
MFAMSSKKVAGVGAALVAVCALSACGQKPAEADSTMQEEKVAPAVELAVHGVIAPLAELSVISPCLEGDTGAKFTSSFGVSGDMHPAADSPNLLGTLELPADVQPSDPNDPHYVTVTCDSSGAESTVRIEERNVHGSGSEALLEEFK